MSHKKASKTLIELFQELYPRLRPTVVMILVLGFSISPLIPSLPWRVGVTSALGVTILFLLFDMFKSINQRLDRIENSLKIQYPPSYTNYSSAFTDIREILEDRLSHNKDVALKIICVSAQNTWKQLIEETLPEFFNVGNGNQKIAVELLIVKPEVLEDWGQQGLRMDAEVTLSRIPLFERTHRAELDRGKISLTVMQYDNIPHWHGILINDEILFKGICKWEKKDERQHLLVGQKEYRKFTADDNFNGSKQIQFFKQWFEVYKVRSKMSSNAPITMHTMRSA